MIDSELDSTSIPVHAKDGAEQDTIALWVRMINKSHRGRQVPRDYGTGEKLHMSEVLLIDRIANNEKVTVTALSEKLGITKAAVSQLVKKLGDRGYIEKQVSGEDQKRKYLSVTSKGDTASRNLRSLENRLRNQLRQQFSEQELLTSNRVQSVIEDYVDELREAQDGWYDSEPSSDQP